MRLRGLCGGQWRAEPVPATPIAPRQGMGRRPPNLTHITRIGERDDDARYSRRSEGGAGGIAQALAPDDRPRPRIRAGLARGRAAHIRAELRHSWSRSSRTWNGNRFAITTNSGTAALHMAVAACGCGAGDQVLVHGLFVVVQRHLRHPSQLRAGLRGHRLRDDEHGRRQDRGGDHAENQGHHRRAPARPGR